MRLHLLENPPSVWYNQQGGQENCIVLRVQLVDADNRPVARSLQISARLLYENKLEVDGWQNIMKVSRDAGPRLALDGQGATELKIRINEVSTRHRGNAFVIMVLVQDPDFTEPVAPIFTSSIIVRAKLPKKERRAQQAARQLQAAAGADRRRRRRAALSACPRAVPHERDHGDERAARAGAQRRRRGGGDPRRG